MIINLLLALVSLLAGDTITASKAPDYDAKHYVDQYGIYRMEKVYDFEHKGLYYEFAGENEVNLVRDSTLIVELAAECPYEEILGWTFEGQPCYTGDIVVPDSVEHEGKKYRVAAVNEHAFSFSKGLRSVVFTSNVELPLILHPKDPSRYESYFGHFCMSKNLQKIVYHDSLAVIENQLNYCPILKKLHLPSKLTSVISCFSGAYIPEIDLANQSSYVAPRFYVSGGFFGSPELRKLKFPDCDTLHLHNIGMGFTNNLEKIVVRPCKTILFDEYELPFGPLRDRTATEPLKLVCEAITPPEVALINQVGEEEFRDRVVLYVPDESMDVYRKANFWKDFMEIRPLTEHLEEEKAEIDEMRADIDTQSQITLRSERDELCITSTAPTEVTVWSLQGEPLWRGNVTDKAIVTLPKGVYIVTTPYRALKYRH